MTKEIGVDIGGTKLEAVVLEGSRPLVRKRCATLAEEGYEKILDRVVTLVHDVATEADVRTPRKIGVGAPGSMRPDGTMKNCNTQCLNGRELRSDLGQLLGIQVALANDADCFALAESTMGSGTGFRTVFGVIMGTGVGGGYVVDSKLVLGPNGLAGEWGHTTLDPDGPACYCGKSGCVETFLSGPAIESYFYSNFGLRLSLKDIAQSRSPDCVKTIDRLCQMFGAALATVVNVLDPEVIVLGGGAGQILRLQTDGRRYLADAVFGQDFVTPLLAPTLGDSAGVIGAALLTRQES